MNEPIGVEAHSLIDYGFLAAAVVVPAALGLHGPARPVPLVFGAVQGGLNALTDQPYAVKRVVPFALHGRSEAVAVPALAVTALATGALGQPRAKAFFAGFLGTLGAVYALTDWHATAAR